MFGVYGMAVLLKSGDFDQERGWAFPAQRPGRPVKLLRGVVATHKSNRGGAAGWGDSLAVGLWSAVGGVRRVGCGGWILWDTSTCPHGRCSPRSSSTRPTAWRDYKVPYWHDSSGERFPGDTKAEENA